MEQQPPKFSRKKVLVFAALFFAVGVVSAGVFNVALDYTNTTGFCTSCHSMKINLEEMQDEPHWSSRTGIHAGCADCHVPKSFGPKMVAKVMAAKDVFHHIIGTIDTPEKFEEHRLKMAKRVWEKMRATDSRECRSCHNYDHMDLSAQDRFARKKHEKAVDRGKTCIDCHRGIAHKLPKEIDGNEDDSEPDAEPDAAPEAGDAPGAGV